jgi:hypothetical protein
MVGGIAGVILSCSSPDPATLQPKEATGDERDTAIKHEPCDIQSTQANKIDVNGDNRPDIIHVMQGGREICRVIDLNLDGSIDAYIYYDGQGLERRRESDFDRDGRADEVTHLRGGMITLKERETNFDNQIDTWDYYAGGRLAKRERDSDGDSIIDQWWEFNNPMDPRCAIVAADRNTDRKPDPDSVVDLCAESYGAPRALPPSLAPAAPFAPGGARPPGAPMPGQPGGPPPPGMYPQMAPPPGMYPQMAPPPGMNPQMAPPMAPPPGPGAAPGAAPPQRPPGGP